ncbi:hypothetical protein M0R89_11575 [Halorussus limi]|uniref:Uncharacterized protein n=1 Tax=Halorussus limi TaxID=2938695 RepID=A0A8U0HQM0_9EURY|nr:hypothetical protein [Halorussus limi]UPV73187.1 hypothetical protein M0R89_11575 [Halorussus limi]
MTDRPLSPSEFAEAVADYADSIDDEGHVRLAYAGQLAAIDDPDREPLSPVEFSAAIIANAGVNVGAADRNRLEHAYQQQIEAARRVGGGRE